MLSSLRECIDRILIRSSGVCAIMINKDGTIVFANSLTEKRQMLAAFREASKSRGKSKPRLMCVWPGEWSSHAFHLSEEKLAECIWTDREFFQKEMEQIRSNATV